DPDDHTYKVFGTDKGANYSAYSNPTIDKILQKARETEDKDENKYKTKVFKNTAENWITNALSNDIKQAEDVRSILNYTLKEKH
ncbi:hypothetical protein ACTPEF_26280, partial [Clostridioides difficile]